MPIEYNRINEIEAMFSFKAWSAGVEGVELLRMLGKVRFHNNERDINNMIKLVFYAGYFRGSEEQLKSIKTLISSIQ